MFNDRQSSASIFSLINGLNHDLYSEPSFPAPQLYLLSHTLKGSTQKRNVLLATKVWNSVYIVIWHIRQS